MISTTDSNYCPISLLFSTKVLISLLLISNLSLIKSSESLELHRFTRSTGIEGDTLSSPSDHVAGLNFEFEPEILAVSGDTIHLKIFPVKEPLRDKTQEYYVIVERLHEQEVSGDSNETRTENDRNYSVNYKQSKESGLTYYAAIKLLPASLSDQLQVIIGDGTSKDGYTNQPLEENKQYRFGLAAHLSDNSYLFIRSSRSIIWVSSESGLVTSLIAVFVVILIILIILIAGLVYYLREAEVDVRWQDVVMIWSKRHRSSLFKDRNRGQRRSDRTRLTSQPESTRFSARQLFSNPAMEVIHRIIDIDQLNQLVPEHGSPDSSLASEYTKVTKDQIMSWLEGTSAINRPKNRYPELPAYDHNRVKLGPDDEFPSTSDYINASFIDGYDEPNKYIACQGPIPSTINDFWKMIWQQNCRQIVMLTVVEESGKIKCEKYWPEKEEATYGAYIIKPMEKKELADYIVRRLLISRGNESREVIHYQYITWHDHSVPSNPGQILKMMNEISVEGTKMAVSSPLVVHCSAGVGRTGTFIMIDYMIQMGSKEGKIDVLGQLYALRKQRIEMIETLSQYIFVHKALRQYFSMKEAIKTPETKVIEQVNLIQVEP